MTLALYTHPFSSYCQKVLTSLYENGTDFTCRTLDHADQAVFAELETLWPLKRFPVLVDGDRPVVESTIIVEYLDRHYPGPVRLIPEDTDAALEVRFLDRFFDNYVQSPVQKMVLDFLRAEEQRDAHGVAEAKDALETAYRWLEQRMKGREWAAGERFTLADCAAAPALFYADWVQPIGENFPAVRAYRTRLNARPSFARAIDEARPYRPLFPPGAPDRD